MYTDAQLRPSGAQSLVGAAGTILSTNLIGLLSANNDLGRGAARRIKVSLASDVVGPTNVQADLVESVNADGSSATVILTGTPNTSKKAGDVLLDAVIPATTKRYIGVRYTTTGAATTAGAVNAHIVLDTDRNPNLPAYTGR